jgi:hypothetical protein
MGSSIHTHLKATSTPETITIDKLDSRSQLATYATSATQVATYFFPAEVAANDAKSAFADLMPKARLLLKQRLRQRQRGASAFAERRFLTAGVKLLLNEFNRSIE